MMNELEIVDELEIYPYCMLQNYILGEFPDVFLIIQTETNIMIITASRRKLSKFLFFKNLFIYTKPKIYINNNNIYHLYQLTIPFFYTKIEECLNFIYGEKFLNLHKDVLDCLCYLQPNNKMKRKLLKNSIFVIKRKELKNIIKSNLLTKKECDNLLSRLGYLLKDTTKYYSGDWYRNSNCAKGSNSIISNSSFSSKDLISIGYDWNFKYDMNFIFNINRVLKNIELVISISGCNLHIHCDQYKVDIYLYIFDGIHDYLKIKLQENFNFPPSQSFLKDIDLGIYQDEKIFKNSVQQIEIVLVQKIDNTTSNQISNEGLVWTNETRWGHQILNSFEFNIQSQQWNWSNLPTTGSFQT